MSFEVPAHVENRRLFDAAAGQLKMNSWEREHVHTCEVCQGVFYVFLNQSAMGSQGPGEPPDPA